jgi:phenylpyruvate tautomerase PptA (4-oxalocrotonate tautomerase family)
MPTVKIELREGIDIKTLVSLRDSVMNAVVESLQLPQDDRNIRIIEYKPDLFLLKAPNEILIEITMFSGRTKETKKNLYQNIVGKLSAESGIDKSKIFIILNEQPLLNWGVRGGIPADEIKLDFKVDI